jgi:hypothetical protein
MNTQKVGEAAINAAKEMLADFPDNGKLVIGKAVYTGKELKQKVLEDETTAEMLVTLLLNLKFNQLSKLAR